MTIIEKEPIPLYETECEECGSRLQYKAEEALNHHVICPVCGVSTWAFTDHPVGYTENEKWDIRQANLRKVEQGGSKCSDCYYFCVIQEIVRKSGRIGAERAYIGTCNGYKCGVASNLRCANFERRYKYEEAIINQFEERITRQAEKEKPE